MLLPLKKKGVRKGRELSLLLLLPFWTGKEEEQITRHCDFCFWKEYALYLKNNSSILASRQSVTLDNYLCVLWSHLNESVRLEKQSSIRKDGYFPVKNLSDWALFDIAVCTISRIGSIRFSLWPNFQKDKNKCKEVAGYIYV